MLATEEAIINALVAAAPMTGVEGQWTHAVPRDRLLGLLPMRDRGQG